MIELLWQSSLGIILFFALYKVFLNDLTFFRLNRAILIGIPFVSVLLTYIKLPAESIGAYSITLPLLEIGSTTNNFLSPGNSAVNLPHWISVVYLVGLSLSTLTLVFKFVRLILFMRKLHFTRRNAAYVANSQSIFSSFSFFNYIHINQSDRENEDLIILHENMHFKLFHSVDNLAMECLKCLFWFNPAIFFIHKELRLVHEYEVDNTLKENDVSLAYIDSLTDESQILREMKLTNPYKSNSNLLNRIKMMYKKPSNSIQAFKYLALIPVLFTIVLAVSCSDATVDSTVEKEEITEELFPVERMNELSKQPEFPGGNQELMVFLGNEINYPEEAKKDGLTGKVIMSFVVSKDGSVKNVQVKNGIHPLLDAEAKRAISSMPAWTPGEYNGKKVAVEFMIPVLFKLDNDE